MKYNQKIKIINHYNKLIKKHSTTHSGMGWRKGGLYKRYNFFKKNINFNNKKIFDFGCGLCFFEKFLKKKKIKYKNYYGFDINSKLIEFQKKNKDKKISLFDKKNKFLKKIHPDICLSNGVHNYNIRNNYKNFYSDINFLVMLSKNIVCITFLSDNVDYRESYLSYKNLKKIKNFLNKKKYKFTIFFPFNKYECVIIIKK